jgi:CspA family cold shock protein
MQATVKSFDDGRGFGWLTPDGGGEAIFIHATQLRESSPRLFALRAGQRVEFKLRNSSHKPGMIEAHRIRLIATSLPVDQSGPRVQPVRFGTLL